MNTLIPCSSCQRHVRNDEENCPFCAEPFVAPDPSNRGFGVKKITRAALFAGAAFLLPALPAVSACGGKQSTTVDRTETATTHDAGPIADASVETDASIEPLDPRDYGHYPPYGAPPSIDDFVV